MAENINPDSLHGMMTKSQMVIIWLCSLGLTKSHLLFIFARLQYDQMRFSPAISNPWAHAT